MGPQSLSALHQLQAVESHLRAIKEKLRRKERHLKQYQVKVKQLEEELVAKKEDIKHRQAQANQLELEFKAHESVIIKHRGQLNSAKTNKEYSLILTQLNTERADNSKLEERILNDLQAVDDMKAAIGDLKKQRETHREQLGEQEKIFQQERQGLDSQIEELERNRQTVSATVRPDDLAIFQRVADRNDGEALAKVLLVSGTGEYLCEGCNMTTPAEKVNALLTRDELQQCNVCGAILFLNLDKEVNRNS